MSDDQVDPDELSATPRKQRKSIGRLARLIRTSLALVWSAGRGLFMGLVVLQLLGAAVLAGQVLAVEAVLEAILDMPGGSGDVSGVVAPVLVLAGLTAFTTVVASLQGNIQRLLGERTAQAMWHRVLDVSTGVSLRHFESPEFYNRLERVQTSALTRPYQVTQGLLALAGATAATVGVGIALMTISPVLLPLLVLGAVPLLVTNRRESRLEFNFTVAQTQALRLRSYLTLLQTGRDEAKEVRAFGLSTWLRSRFDTVYDAYVRALTTHVRKRTILSLLGNLGAAIGLAATMLVLVWLIGEGSIQVAGAGAAIVAIRMLATQIRGIFTSTQKIFESGLFLDDLQEFLDLGAAAHEEDDGAPAPEDFATIAAQHVTFSYPGSRPALRDVSVELGRGEIVALVGENGSGKTTLAKLLAGLYDPTEGRITWDGADIRTFRRSELRRNVTVVFQDFVRYAISAAENIAVGRVDTEATPEAVTSAARAAGIASTIEGLPEGYDTTLSRLFPGGRELSGGQWQRVALARSFFRDAPLVILDEPSASLDPRAEHDLFASLRDALGGRTALFISHRFSTVRGADRIYVLDKGAIVEHGSHPELMAREGLYAELFRLQSDAYVSGMSGSPDTPGS